MKGFADHSRDRPPPELLAAYADGELDSATRARIDAWLNQHPEARAELEAQQRLSRHNQRLWRASAGPSPSEASWLRLFARVQTALAAPPQPAPARRPRLLRFAIPAVTAAAVLAVLVLRPPIDHPPQPAPPGEEPLVVAADADIEIVSIREADTERLVVGKPPLTGPVVLASSAEVVMEKMAQDANGQKARMMQAEANTPMVVAPVAGR